ncbi:MAG: HdeD family acid-resistance protein [Rhizobiaceae bacterium]
MTFSGDVPDKIKDAIGAARSKWGWFVALGALMLAAGIIAMGNLLLATVASVFFVGTLMLVAGAFQIVHAFGVKDWGGFFWWLGAGVLYTLAGFVAFWNPLLASAVLTFLLAVSLIASGLLRVWMGYRHWTMKGSGWIVAAGIVTAVAGLIIALGWPVNSLWVLGIFLAIDLIFQGWTFIAFGLALRK